MICFPTAAWSPKIIISQGKNLDFLLQNLHFLLIDETHQLASSPTPLTLTADMSTWSLQVINPQEPGCAVLLQTRGGACRVLAGHGGQDSHGGQTCGAVVRVVASSC